MQHVYIPSERLSILKKERKILRYVSDKCNCKLKIDDDVVIVDGDAYSELIAKNVIYAFGRGFDIDQAISLSNEERYFSSIDLKHAFSSENRIKQIKARIIGVKGKTKRYIESVSGVKMSVYGDTISLIGSYDAIYEAETAVRAIIEGRNHRVAYLRMEAAHRKNKERNRASLIKT